MPDNESLLASVLLQMTIKEFDLAYAEIEDAFDRAPQGLTRTLIEEISGKEVFDLNDIKAAVATKAGEETHDELLHTGYFEMIEKVIVCTYIAGLGDSVEECLKRLDPLFPDQGATYLGVRCFLKGMYADGPGALADGEDAYKLDPANVLAAHNCAVTLGASHKADEAIVLLDDLVKTGYTSTGMMTARARVYYKNDNEKAQELINEVVKNDPGSINAVSMRTLIQVELGEMDLSMESLMGSVQGLMEHSTLSEGGQLYTSGQYEEAVVQLRKELDADPFDHFTWDLLAGCYHIMGRLEDAKEASREARRLAPEDSGWIPNAVAIAMDIGEYETALEYLDKAIKEDPEYDPYVIDKVDALLGLERGDEALELLKSLVETVPDPMYYARLARMLADMNQPDEAVSVLDKALSIDPLNDALMYDKVEVLKYYERWEEAWEVFDLIKKLDPSVVQDHSGRGEALWNLGRIEEAEEELNRALELDPIDVYTLQIKAGMLAEAGKFDEALASIGRALEVIPDDGRSLELKSMIMEEKDGC